MRCKLVGAIDDINSNVDGIDVVTAVDKVAVFGLSMYFLMYFSVLSNVLVNVLVKVLVDVVDVNDDVDEVRGRDRNVGDGTDGRDGVMYTCKIYLSSDI